MPWKARVKALGLQAIAMRTVAEWELIDRRKEPMRTSMMSWQLACSNSVVDLARSGRNLYLDEAPCSRISDTMRMFELGRERQSPSASCPQRNWEVLANGAQLSHPIFSLFVLPP